MPTSGAHVVLETYRLNWTELVNGSWGDFRAMCTNAPSRESSEILTMTGANLYRTLPSLPADIRDTRCG